MSDVVETAIAAIAQISIGITGVGDEDIPVGVIVEVGDETHARFTGNSEFALQGDILEGSLLAIPKGRASFTAAIEEIVPAIAV